LVPIHKGRAATARSRRVCQGIRPVQSAPQGRGLRTLAGFDFPMRRNSGPIRSPIRLNLTAIAPVPLSARDKPGHYEVVSLRGHGGIGEVLAVYSAGQKRKGDAGRIYRAPHETI
jgi:hypothetical protein